MWTVPEHKAQGALILTITVFPKYFNGIHIQETKQYNVEKELARVPAFLYHASPH